MGAPVQIFNAIKAVLLSLFTANHPVPQTRRIRHDGWFSSRNGFASTLNETGKRCIAGDHIPTDHQLSLKNFGDSTGFGSSCFHIQGFFQRGSCSSCPTRPFTRLV